MSKNKSLPIRKEKSVNQKNANLKPTILAWLKKTDSRLTDNLWAPLTESFFKPEKPLLVLNKRNSSVYLSNPLV